MITKEEEKAFLTFVKKEFEKKTGAPFGTYRGKARERDKIVGMISRVKPTSLSELKNFYIVQLHSWHRWPSHTRENLIGFIFKDASYILWRAQQSKSIAGKSNVWDDL